MDQTGVKQHGLVTIMDETGMQLPSPFQPENRASAMTTIAGQETRQLEFEQEQTLTNFHMDNKSKDSINTRIDRAMVPRVGMEFQTEEEAYEFYNAYALECGFCVRRSKSHSYRQKVLDRNFVCSCEGKRGRDKRDDIYKSHRPETRFGCLAMMKISCRQRGKYCVVKFIPEHNHSLASPSEAHLFRSHRRVSISQPLEVYMAEVSGIAPVNGFQDYKNYLRTKRSLQMRPGDAGDVLEYMQMKQIDDPSFFYAIQVDEDDLITNIFWADAKMMADYDDFGDVVCLDTTYRKHKDGRPIALFVGVNHHKQTTVFGCALLYDETVFSFIWLFDTFSRAMGGKLPKTILTDQDAAMSLALDSRWPETHHRLCIWHVLQNAATHLSHVFAKFKEFAVDLSHCVYDHDHEEDFLDAWSKLLDKYELQNNDWLKRMFEIKEKWALVYGRDTFCADMISTQRSETMNKLIKNYVSYNYDMRSFFGNFQRLLNDRRNDEIVADFKAKHSKVRLSFPVEILKHAVGVYTPEVFKLFEEELCKSYDCPIEICGEVHSSVKYVVTPRLKHYNYVVSYDATGEDTVYCSCKKFEFSGIICSHILKMFSIRGIVKVPDKYILKRWTQDANKGSGRVGGESSEGVDPKVLVGRRYRDLCRLSTRLITRAAEFEDIYTTVKEGLTNMLRDVDLRSTEKASHSSFGSDPIDNMLLCNPDMTQKLKTRKRKCSRTDEEKQLSEEETVGR